MKSLLTAAIAAGALLTLATPASSEILIKFSHVTAATGNPKGDAATILATRINERMKGKVRMQVFPNSQLYNDDKVLEAMLLGDVQMAAPSLSKFERYTKKFRIFDLPFLFNDIKAVDRFQNSAAGQELLGALKAKGLHGLGYWHNGMKQMSAKKPLILPADAAGLKFRIQTSDVLEGQFRALKSNPQKMAFNEVYGALQTGVVDGQENTWSNIYTKKFFEVQDGITETDHGIIDYLVVTGASFWKGLPKDIRTQLDDIIKGVTAESNAASEKINLANRAKIIKAGSKVRVLTPAQKSAWQKAMQPVWEKFQGQIGKDLIDAALAANAS